MTTESAAAFLASLGLDLDGDIKARIQALDPKDRHDAARAAHLILTSPSTSTSTKPKRRRKKATEE